MKKQKWRKYRNEEYEELYEGYKNSDVLFASGLTVGDIIVCTHTGRQAMVLSIETDEKLDFLGWMSRWGMNQNYFRTVRQGSIFYPNDERYNGKYKAIVLQYLTNGVHHNGEVLPPKAYFFISDTQERTERWNRTTEMASRWATLKEYSETKNYNTMRKKWVEMGHESYRESSEKVLHHLTLHIEPKLKSRKIMKPDDLIELARDVLEDGSIGVDDIRHHCSDMFTGAYGIGLSLSRYCAGKDWFYQLPEEMEEYLEDDIYDVTKELDIEVPQLLLVGNFRTGHFAARYGSLRSVGSHISTPNNHFNEVGEFNDGRWLKEGKKARDDRHMFSVGTNVYIGGER